MYSSLGGYVVYNRIGFILQLDSLMPGLNPLHFFPYLLMLEGLVNKPDPRSSFKELWSSKRITLVSVRLS